MIKRELHGELKGTGYVLIDRADGRVHHLRFDDINMTGDTKVGVIVELWSWEDGDARYRL